jgi:hypothetical protein
MSSNKVTIFLSDFNDTTFLKRFSTNPQNSNIIKIRLVEAELLLTDRNDEVISRLFAILQWRANLP